VAEGVVQKITLLVGVDLVVDVFLFNYLHPRLAQLKQSLLAPVACQSQLLLAATLVEQLR
jgi:hypothetical protein